MRTVREIINGRKWKHWSLRQSPAGLEATLHDMRGLFTSLAARVKSNPNFDLDDADKFLRKPAQRRRIDMIVARIDGGDKEQIITEVIGLVEARTDIKPGRP